MKLKHLMSIPIGFIFSSCGVVENPERDYQNCLEDSKEVISSQYEYIEKLKSELGNGYIVKRTRTDLCTKYRKYDSGKTYCSNYHYDTDYIPIDHQEWRKKIRSEEANLVDLKKATDGSINGCKLRFNSAIRLKEAHLTLEESQKFRSIMDKLSQAKEDGNEEAVEKYRKQFAKLDLEYEQKKAELPELK